MKKNIFKIFFIIWAVLWMIFLARELFIKANFKDYAALFSRTLEGKHAYVTGDDLYIFLKKCENDISENSTYKLVGIEEGSIEQRRIAYYLYPRLRNDKADFVIDVATHTIKKNKE